MLSVDISIIFRLAALAMVITIFHSFLKQAGRDEYAYMTLLVGLAIALLWVIPLIIEFFRAVRVIFQMY